MTFGKVLAAMDREPELAHEAAAGRAGPRRGDIDLRACAALLGAP